MLSKVTFLMRLRFHAILLFVFHYLLRFPCQIFLRQLQPSVNVKLLDQQVLKVLYIQIIVGNPGTYRYVRLKAINQNIHVDLDLAVVYRDPTRPLLQIVCIRDRKTVDWSRDYSLFVVHYTQFSPRLACKIDKRSEVMLVYFCSCLPFAPLATRNSGLFQLVYVLFTGDLSSQK